MQCMNYFHFMEPYHIIASFMRPSYEVVALYRISMLVIASFRLVGRSYTSC